MANNNNQQNAYSLIVSAEAALREAQQYLQAADQTIGTDHVLADLFRLSLAIGAIHLVQIPEGYGLQSAVKGSPVVNISPVQVKIMINAYQELGLEEEIPSLDTNTIA